MTSRQTIAVDLTKMEGSTVETSWFNPREGTMTPAGKFNKRAVQEFTPPAIGDLILRIKGLI